jgi:hypothetical protein
MYHMTYTHPNPLIVRFDIYTRRYVEKSCATMLIFFEDRLIKNLFLKNHILNGDAYNGVFGSRGCAAGQKFETSVKNLAIAGKRTRTSDLLITNQLLYQTELFRLLY